MDEWSARRQASTYTLNSRNTEQTHTNILASSGFEPTTTAFERTKTVHASDRAATVIGLQIINIIFSSTYS
jgi:hypothetical protein